MPAPSCRKSTWSVDLPLGRHEPSDAQPRTHQALRCARLRSLVPNLNASKIVLPESSASCPASRPTMRYPANQAHCLSICVSQGVHGARRSRRGWRREVVSRCACGSLLAGAADHHGTASKLRYPGIETAWLLHTGVRSQRGAGTRSGWHVSAGRALPRRARALPARAAGWRRQRRGGRRAPVNCRIDLT
jgi:hypothetical protein